MAPKYQLIADELRAHIQDGKYASAPTLPTEFAIASEYQVSRQTVRQALSLLARDGIIEKRQGSGSHIVRRSSVLPSVKRRTIAVIVTYISDYIFPNILREVEDILAQNNCAPSLFSTQNQVATERKILTDLLTLPVDGILAEATKSALPNPNLDLYQQLMDKGIPLVFIHGRYANLSGTPSILDANYDGGRQLVRYLHTQGHKHIGGIFKSDDIQGHGRYAGYTAGLREAGLPLEDRNVYWFDTAIKRSLIAGDDTPIRLYLDELKERVDSLVCYNDEIASFCTNQLPKRGVRIPGDIALVSFDNSPYSEFSSIPITSLSHGEQNVGRIGAETLIKCMNGELCQSLQVPWILVERESSKKV